MFISEKNNKNVLRSLLIYLGISAFVAAFGAVYEHFGHGVVSLAMYLAFLYPLCLGALPYFILLFLPIKISPSFLTQNVYNAGVAILTTGSIYRGVVEIYGTPREEMCLAYVIIGVSLIAVSVALFLVGLFIKRPDKLNKNNITE